MVSWSFDARSGRCWGYVAYEGGFRLRFRVWGSLLGEGTGEQLQSLKANNDVPRTQAKRCARTGENGNENKDIKHVPYVAPGGLAEWGQAGAEAQKKPLPGEEAHVNIRGT